MVGCADLDVLLVTDKTVSHSEQLITMYVLGTNTELYRDVQRRLSIINFVDEIFDDFQFPAWMIPTDNATPSVSRQMTLDRRRI